MLVYFKIVENVLGWVQEGVNWTLKDFYSF